MAILQKFVLLAVCFLLPDNAQCRKQNRSNNETAAEEFFSTNEKRIPPAIPLFIGLSSLSMGSASRLFGHLGSIEAARRHRQLVDKLDDFQRGVSTLIGGLRSHSTFLSRNVIMNKVISACQRFESLHTEIEAEDGGTSKESRNKRKDKATLILTGKRKDGAELNYLRDGVKEVLREFDEVFFGPRLGFPKGSIILLFAESLDPRSVDFLDNTLMYLGELLTAQEMCVKAMRRACKEQKEMKSYCFSEAEYNLKKTKYEEGIADIFSNPIMGPYAWYQVSKSSLPSARNVVKTPSYTMLCQVKKDSGTYTGVVAYNKNCIYGIKGKTEVQEAEEFEVLYDRCTDYPIQFAGSSGLPILSDGGKEMCREEFPNIHDTELGPTKYESFGTLNEGVCIGAYEYRYTGRFNIDMMYMRYRDKQLFRKNSNTVVKTECNIFEKYSKINKLL